MALWLPKWMRQDTPPEPENVHRRYFLMAGAAAAASAVLPPFDPVFSTFSAQQLLNERNPLQGMLERDAYLAYYRCRQLYGTVRINRAALMENVAHPGAWRGIVEMETRKALAEVYAEAERNGIELPRVNPSFYSDRVLDVIERVEGDPLAWPGREHVVPIAVSEAGRFVDEHGRELHQVRVPTRDLMPRVRIGGDDAS